MVVRSPALARTLVEAGHEVAVHGWTHRGLLATGPRVTHTGLSRTRSLICAVTGQTPRFFRPAYGILTTPALLAAYRLDLTPVLWTNWGRDWEPAATPDSVLRTVSAGLRGGATVLLHDGNPGQAWRSTLGALPGLLDYCAHRGWAVGPLRDHFHPTVP
jgi:peptidoglycan/xylan/chitin deacetylase (PgdA/CDA1 family)